MIKKEETELSLFTEELTLYRNPEFTDKLRDLMREFSKVVRLKTLLYKRQVCMSSATRSR